MEKITSFTIDHNKLLRGLYVSRKDKIGAEVITTFDLRMKEPNREPVIDMPALHTIEHLGATFLRNSPEWQDKVVYFGPMGCRTGYYIVLAGDLESKDVVDLVTDMFKHMAEFKGDVPGASPVECGNYTELNLNMANYEAKKFLDEVLTDIKEENLIYPN